MCAHVGEVVNSAITGIRDPEREGFLASTLFSQGWNITLRALDFDAISQLCTAAAPEKATIILATDLEGLTPASIAELKSRGYPVFLFAPKDSAPTSFTEVQEFPTSALELISLMRGSLRAPLIRAHVERSCPCAHDCYICISELLWLHSDCNKSRHRVELVR